MKAAITVMALLLASLWTAFGPAQSDDRFQSVSGDYGRNVISSLTANETKATAASNNSNNTLWNWGNMPKGSRMVNGSLVSDPFSTGAAIENPASTYTQVGVDAFSGRAIYSYRPSDSSAAKYFYVDPYTGLPVYVDWADVTTDAYSSPSSGSGSYSLPSAFR